MSLPGRQQRVLDRIEKRLLGDDLRLGSLFAVFYQAGVGGCDAPDRTG
jgi:hypothetical protein